MIYTPGIFMNCFASGITISLTSYVGAVMIVWVLILFLSLFDDVREGA